MSGRVDSRKTHETARSRKPAAPRSRPKAQETPAPTRCTCRAASGGGASPQVRAQRQAVGRALRTGETFRFPSRHGHQATVRLQGPERENGSSVYRGRVDGLPVELRLPAGRDGRAALTRAVVRQTATSTPVGGNRRDLMREIDEHTASARDRKRVDSVRQVLSTEPWSTAPESLRALYLRAGRPVDSAAQADEIVPLVRAERHRSGDEVLLLEFDVEGRERRADDPGLTLMMARSGLGWPPRASALRGAFSADACLRGLLTQAPRTGLQS